MDQKPDEIVLRLPREQAELLAIVLKVSRNIGLPSGGRYRVGIGQLASLIEAALKGES